MPAVFLAAILLVSVFLGARTAAAVEPETVRASEADEHARIRRAAVDAVLRIDEEGSESRLVEETGRMGEFLRVFLEHARAARRATAAYAKLRGVDGEMGAQAAGLHAELARLVETGEVTVSGDEAKIAVPRTAGTTAPGFSEMFLRREAGAWKLDMLRSMPLDIASGGEDLRKMTRAFDAVAAMFESDPKNARRPFEALIAEAMLKDALADPADPNKDRPEPEVRRIDARADDPVASGEVARMLPGGRVRALALSRDGAIAASGGSMSDAAVVLWDLGSGKELRPLEWDARTEFHAAAVAFSPDGRFVAAGGWAYEREEVRRARAEASEPGAEYKALEPSGFAVRVWEVATGKVVRRLEGHTGKVLSLDWSPDGKTLASASEDGTARIWYVAAGSELRALDAGGLVFGDGPERWPVGSVRFSRWVGGLHRQSGGRRGSPGVGPVYRRSQARVDRRARRGQPEPEPGRIGGGVREDRGRAAVFHRRDPAAEPRMPVAHGHGEPGERDRVFD